MSRHLIDDEHGGVIEVDLHHHDDDRYTVVIAGELLDQSPEAITAALAIALHNERTSRRRRRIL